MGSLPPALSFLFLLGVQIGWIATARRAPRVRLLRPAPVDLPSAAVPYPCGCGRFLCGRLDSARVCPGTGRALSEHGRSEETRSGVQLQGAGSSLRGPDRCRQTASDTLRAAGLKGWSQGAAQNWKARSSLQ